MMRVQINSDNQIKASETEVAAIETMVRARLDRHAERLTRVEVHLGDANADNDVGKDKICTIEARPKGLDPVAATDHATTVEASVNGALGKLMTVLERTFARQGR
jgi:ribosome-associated translation inhibitor RaiA